MTYVVTAPYVTIKVPTTTGTTLVGFYVNAPIPAGADEEAIARLLRKGMIAEQPVASTESEPEPEPEIELDPPAGDRPKDYASKPEWVDYAVTRRAEGVSEESARSDAEAKSKADLITEYGN